MIIIREATENDINSILMLRYQAKENVLHNQITYPMIAKCLKTNCKAWVAEDDEVVVGFSLANKKLKTVWGLFILSRYQDKGLGGRLLDLAVNWLKLEAKTWFNRPCKRIWLDTEIGGRAEEFYQSRGWVKGRPISKNQVRYWYYFNLK